MTDAPSSLRSSLPAASGSHRRAAGIQVSSRYLSTSSTASAAATRASSTALGRKRPAPETVTAAAASVRGDAPIKRAKKSAAAPAAQGNAPKTPRKKSLAPGNTAGSASTAITPRRRTTGVGTAADRELAQLAASLRSRPAAEPGTAAGRRDTTASIASTTGSKLDTAPPRVARKSTAAPPASASRKSKAPGNSAAPTPSLSPIPLDPSWNESHTHSLHRLLQWTYLVTSTRRTNQADHESLRTHLTRAADLIDMRKQLLDALRDRITWEHVHQHTVHQVRDEAERVQQVVDRIVGSRDQAAAGSAFCTAHAKLIRAVQSHVDALDVVDSNVSSMDEFVDQVQAAGKALEVVLGALDGNALEAASKEVDMLLANTTRLVELEVKEKQLLSELHGIELRVKSLAVPPPPTSSIVGAGVMTALGL